MRHSLRKADTLTVSMSHMKKPKHRNTQERAHGDKRASSRQSRARSWWVGILGGRPLRGASPGRMASLRFIPGRVLFCQQRAPEAYRCSQPSWHTQRGPRKCMHWLLPTFHLVGSICRCALWVYQQGSSGIGVEAGSPVLLLLGTAQLTKSSTSLSRPRNLGNASI